MIIDIRNNENEREVKPVLEHLEIGFTTDNSMTNTKKKYFLFKAKGSDFYFNLT